jgi:hypothetical protein
MIQKRVEAARQRQRERNNSRTRQSSVEEQSEVLPVGPIALPSNTTQICTRRVQSQLPRANRKWYLRSLIGVYRLQRCHIPNTDHRLDTLPNITQIVLFQIGIIGNQKNISLFFRLQIYEWAFNCTV